MSPSSVRGIVLLFNVYFHGFGESERLQLTDDIVLAALNKAEQDRIRHFTGQQCYVRLEFFGILPDFPSFDLPWSEHLAAARKYVVSVQPLTERMSQLTSLVALTARLHPNHYSILADVWNGKEWKRIHPLRLSFLRDEQHSAYPGDRLATWSSLCDNWPKAPTAQLLLSLRYYLGSISSRQRRDMSKSFLSAAMSVEILVGYQAGGEITKTIAERGGHLVAAGGDGLIVGKVLKALYRSRSSLVHSGKSPNMRDLVAIQQYLMAALPHAIAAHPLPKHADLLDDLDAANFGQGQITSRLNAGGWWSYVPIGVICAQYLEDSKS